jgi:hypothetical protein
MIINCSQKETNKYIRINNEVTPITVNESDIIIIQVLEDTFSALENARDKYQNHLNSLTIQDYKGIKYYFKKITEKHNYVYYIEKNDVSNFENEYITPLPKEIKEKEIKAIVLLINSAFTQIFFSTSFLSSVILFYEVFLNKNKWEDRLISRVFVLLKSQKLISLSILLFFITTFMLSIYFCLSLNLIYNKPWQFKIELNLFLILCMIIIVSIFSLITGYIEGFGKSFFERFKEILLILIIGCIFISIVSRLLFFGFLIKDDCFYNYNIIDENLNYEIRDLQSRLSNYQQLKEDLDKKMENAQQI